MKGTTKVEIGDDGVAIITILNPPLNLLSVDGNRLSSPQSYIFSYDWLLYCWFQILYNSSTWLTRIIAADSYIRSVWCIIIYLFIFCQVTFLILAAQKLVYFISSRK